MYERVGGDAFFRKLVGRFYAGVRTDPVLRPLYPDDLGPSEDHLGLFLIQYWGGPQTYNSLRGHPRLRMRHAPFVVSALERDAWLRHMSSAVREMGMEEADQEEMLAYFEMAAHQLVNTA